MMFFDKDVTDILGYVNSGKTLLEHSRRIV